jgi:hypothetical protein
MVAIAVQEGDMGFSIIGTKCRPLSPAGVANVQRLANLKPSEGVARQCSYKFIPKKDEEKKRIGQQKQKKAGK